MSSTRPALVRSSKLSLRSLKVLLAEIDAYGSEHSLSANDLFAVKLALDELGTNLLMHGSLPGVVPRLRMRLEHDQGSMQFLVQDNGRPFDPTQAPPPPSVEGGVAKVPVGGVGLTLLRGFVRGLAYRYEDGWNELRLEYDRTASQSV